MFNFYLFNKSYEKANTAQIEENFRVLNDLVIAERAKEDDFLKNESIWYCDTADGTFCEVVSKMQDKQLSQQVLPKILQTIPSISEEFSTIEEFDKSPFRIYNAFYGIVFDEPLLDKYISNKETYLTFKNKYLSDITPKTLWERKELLFSKVVLCPDVEDNLKNIEVKDLTTIVDKLTDLDAYVAVNWISGSFNYHKANEQISLRISPESESTMNKYRKERLFRMPDGTTKCFELHIKIGSSLRIHFYPENGKIFIGYIGIHLLI
jgi:hypothetical protein